MDEHYLQWLSLLLRWIHVVTGVSWIVASFYLNWLEGNFNRQAKQDKTIEGDFWAVHDPNLGKKALQRSLHNNYLTLPVLFIMFSNHYPLTFANRYNWQILACLCLIGAGTRHYFNLKNRGQQKVWTLPLACLAMLTLAFITKPTTFIMKPATMQPASFTTTSSAPTLASVTAVFKQRCVSCHSAHPTDETFHFRPNGVIFDTPEQIASQTGLIKQQEVIAKRMPLANKTKKTEGERELIA